MYVRTLHSVPRSGCETIAFDESSERPLEGGDSLVGCCSLLVGRARHAPRPDWYSLTDPLRPANTQLAQVGKPSNILATERLATLCLLARQDNVDVLFGSSGRR